MSREQDAAAQAAIAVAQSLGLQAAEAKLLGGYSNILIKLDPFALVARVSGTSAQVRQDFDWMEQEVAIAQFLAGQGASTLRPASRISPGPHRHGEVAMTFWEFVDVLPDEPSPVETGLALAALHEKLADCPLQLPYLRPITEGLDMLARDDIAGQIPGDVRPLIQRRSDHVAKAIAGLETTDQPLHGDPHYGNLLRTPHGLLWSDFEDACSGPIEWDVACMVTSSLVLGTGRAAQAALAAYGRPVDAQLLDHFVEARTLQALAWAFAGIENAATHPRVTKRLAWLAER